MTQTANEVETPKQAFFGVQRVFLKGMSLELPLGSKLFLEQGAPALNLALQVSNEQLAPDAFEVCLQATLTASQDGKTLYLLEVQQAGIFQVRDATPQQTADILEIGGPSILAPYLRAQISEALTRATLAPFYTPEVNWAAMALEQRAAAAASKTATVH